MSKKAHIIGICGVAMSATAKLLIDGGYEVTGSDEAFYPPSSEYVKKLGVSVQKGYKASNIPTDVDLIVIGRNTKLSPENNEEVKRAKELGVPVRSFPEIVSELSDGSHKIVVAGSYGKSTVTSLISFALESSGKDPGYFIGAYPIDFDHSAKIGSDIFIIEGDEYPSAHWDNRSKFLHFSPNDVLLTAIEHDHVNVFPTYESYKKPFENLIKNLPTDGLLVACLDNHGVKDVIQLASNVVTYGLDTETDWSARSIKYGDTTTFDLTHKGEVITKLSTKLLGKHNIQNIVGASALLLEKKLVTETELQKGIKEFSGIKRRLNKITNEKSIPTYEGFGSSYEKARAAIEAIKLHFPEKSLTVLFEPHTFSWRNKDSLSWYKTAFDGAENVLVYKPAEQGASTHDQLTHKDISRAVKEVIENTYAVSSEDDIKSSLNKALKGSDNILLILTSGSLDGILDELPQWLNSTYENV